MWGAWLACTTQALNSTAQAQQHTQHSSRYTEYCNTAASACVPLCQKGNSLHQTVPARAKDMQMGAATFVMARMAAGMDHMPSPAISPDAAAGTYAIFKQVNSWDPTLQQEHVKQSVS